MDLVHSQAKINCIFANEVYNQYQSKRYGVSSCTHPKPFYNLLDLYNLKTMLDIYNNNSQQYQLDILTTNLSGNKLDSNRHTIECDCDISELIEKINLL